MKIRPINEDDYKVLLELDKKVYPTANPVTIEILKQWYQRNPEFGIIFEENNEIKGMLIVIPLNKDGWQRLINGELAEGELDSTTIFDISRDHEIGLHGYHIEKLDTNLKHIYDLCFNELAHCVYHLKRSNPNLKVAGFSALAVTSKGIGLCYNKFNCRERDFLCIEHILKKDNQLIVIDTDNFNDIKEKLDQKYEYINRCKMLVSYPDEISIIWRYF